MKAQTETNPSSRSTSGNGASLVEKTPGVCGGDACIRKNRITVAGLVEWRQPGLSDSQILDR